MLRTTPNLVSVRPVDRGDAWHADALSARPILRKVPKAPDPTVAFLAGVLDHDAMATAEHDAARLGVTPDAALLASRWIDDETFYRVLARQSGVAFVTRNARVAPGLDVAAAAQAGIAPLQRWPGGPRWIIAPRGRIDARDFVLTTPRHFERFLREADPAGLAANASATLDLVAPDMSARRLLPPASWPAAGAALAAIVVIAWLAGGWFVAAVVAALWCGFAGAVVQRLASLFAGLETDASVRDLPDRALPHYTLVIALYREAKVAGDLIAAIEALDYPRAKLDVKFVVECDDAETRRALARHLPGVEYDIIVAPQGEPRTKPRALNVALPFARGELLAVYDAEDRPDPRQLRRAASMFARMPSDVACLQARLAIDNERKGWLQALYALDYAALFGLTNKGLAFFGLPVFLGGTSNHFRRAVLVEIGGWDAWNVTEDADLGVRLARFGFRVETFASVTNEEAPVTWRGFLGQRVRWKKGWMRLAGQRSNAFRSKQLAY